jgi:hypothetical protein
MRLAIVAAASGCSWKLREYSPAFCCAGLVAYSRTSVAGWYDPIATSRSVRAG